MQRNLSKFKYLPNTKYQPHRSNTAIKWCLRENKLSNHFIKVLFVNYSPFQKKV